MSVDSIIKKKSYLYANRIVQMYKYLSLTQKEYILSKQVLRSGTSIGANITEAIFGSSKKDFVSKLRIARKETAETLYWLDLLHDGKYLNDTMHSSMVHDCEEIMAMLTTSIKSASKDENTV